MPYPLAKTGALAGRILLAGLLAGHAVVAEAGTRADARLDNGNTSVVSSSSFNTGNSASATLRTTVGGAFASASASPGHLGGQTAVILDSSDFQFGLLSAVAQASSRDRLTFGSGACDQLGCSSWSQLGVASILVDFNIRAAGTVSAFTIDHRFNFATSSISFDWSLQGGRSSVSGGGYKERSETGDGTGSIASEQAQLLLRPGDLLELDLNFLLFSQANIQDPRFSGFTSYHSVALSDFSHTLEWGGITGFTAFDANGVAVDISPSARFTLLSDDGFDFWNSAASFGGTAAVPEPGIWAMLIAGFGLTGGAMRRRHRLGLHRNRLEPRSFAA